MATETNRLLSAAHAAIQASDWNQVNACAFELLRVSPNSADAPFLMGLAQKAANRHEAAADYFERAMGLDDTRHDAAIERAFQLTHLQRYADAKDLLKASLGGLADSAHYMDLGGSAYFAMSLYDAAWPCFETAVQLQPSVDAYQIHRAECAVYVGHIDIAQQIYSRLLKKQPRNQRYHFEFAQLQTASDDRHIKQMQKLLRKLKQTPANAIYLYYALGKEMEDLKRWREAFEYYAAGGNAVKSIATGYRVQDDVSVIDAVVETCSADWIQTVAASANSGPTPIFIVGLPRTGTTLTDRILSSHSQVQSAGESQLLQMVLRNGARAGNQVGMNAELIRLAARREPASVAAAYRQAMDHKIGDKAFFIEKLPENILYLGFIAKAWPDARIVHLRRHPLDACFAMFKQSYFRFAYSLQDLAAYYVAYDRLTKHWREVLGERVVELQYEELVADLEGQTRRMLDKLGLVFETECLDMSSNVTPVATASSVQVREGVHTRSVAKWKHFERQLEPLRDALRAGGVDVDDGGS